MTILWNEVTIWWNEVTKGWNEVVWNEVVMERSDRIPVTYINEVDIGRHIYISTRTDQTLFSLQGTDASRLHYFYGLLFKNKG